MKYICVTKETGAQGYVAPSRKVKKFEQPCGTILKAIGKVSSGDGFIYYVVLEPKTLFIPVDQVSFVEEI